MFGFVFIGGPCPAVLSMKVPSQSGNLSESIQANVIVMLRQNGAGGLADVFLQVGVVGPHASDGGDEGCSEFAADKGVWQWKVKE